ncbi:uncharacterized protein KY384_005313 [Bacidia gigantensis]|uniref:uncharacterized protein n=1 Tax=Bacidia gigantensis TaxID=2732470 RepID=UPI001D05123E|nr:uncharacterized protein KY384_005313 [Bacidia gigantensis]KAG8529832.1 hypothetical protein KY384_005313 [Bacidia gigantensis]
MSPRTYIGPFGRILPLPEGSEPEQQLRDAVEDRTEPRLPQPELNFGSDTTIGPSDPTSIPTSPLPPSQDSDTPRPNAHQGSGDSRQYPLGTIMPPQGSFQEASNIAFGSHPSSMMQGDSHLYSPYSNLDLNSRGSVPLRSPFYLSPQQLPQGTSFQHGPAFAQHSEIPAQASSHFTSHYAQPVSPPYQISKREPDERAFTSATLKEASPSQVSPNEVKPMPRVMREEIRPDQGPVWVYEDGTTCPKLINGELVNADWGVTKAGKPRKRLAIACTSCREKKIKCDPAEPKCAQCKKLGRDCKYSTVPRHPHIRSESPSYKSQAHTKFVNGKTDSKPFDDHYEGKDLPWSGKVESLTPQHKPITVPAVDEGRQSLKFADLSPSIKKRKLSPPTCLQDLPDDSKGPDICNKATGGASPFTYSQTVSRSELCTGDFGGSIETWFLNHYLELFFTNVGIHSKPYLNQVVFMEWLNTDEAKLPRSLIFVHAILAVGTTFSKKEEHKAHGKYFSEVTKRALSNPQDDDCSLLSQTRLFLALYYMASADCSEAWSLAASSLRVSIKSEMTKEHAQGIG